MLRRHVDLILGGFHCLLGELDGRPFAESALDLIGCPEGSVGLEQRILVVAAQKIESLPHHGPGRVERFRGTIDFE